MKKKTRLQFFFQNVKKKSENVLNYEKVDWNFHQKSEQKTICHNFLEGSAPYTAVFVRDFVSKHLTGPCASNKLVLEYCLLTFLNPDRFLYFRHFFCAPIQKQISPASIFMILTIFCIFIHCEEVKEFCSKFLQAQKIKISKLAYYKICYHYEKQARTTTSLPYTCFYI